MAKQTSTITAAVLSLIGATLIFINVMLVASNGAPILISSHSVSSVEQIAPEVLSEDGNVVYVGMNASEVMSNITGSEIRYKPFWGRISLGIPGLVEGPLMLLWITIAVINLSLTIILYLRPTKIGLSSFLIILFSILSVFTGGGFMIGLILGVIGGGMRLQWPATPGETFFGKLIRAAKLDSKLYGSAKENPGILREAALALIFINILSGLGSGLYTYNVDKILNSGASEFPFRILLLGEISVGAAVFGPPVIYIGIAIMKWLLLSFIIYVIGQLTSASLEFNEIARSIAFAYAPVSLQVFLPFLFTNEPFLSVQWPLTIFLVTNIWMIFALIVAVKKSFDFSTSKAIGLVTLAGTIYWFVVYVMLVPTFNIPGIQVNLLPNEIVFVLMSCSAVLSILLGTFTKR